MHLISCILLLPIIKSVLTRNSPGYAFIFLEINI